MGMSEGADTEQQLCNMLAPIQPPLIHLFEEMLTQCLGALQAVIPFCNAVEIPVIENDAYDEWENIVQQCFDSFVILSVTDGDTMAPRRFKKLGYQFSDRVSKQVFSASTDHNTYILFDILSEDGKTMVIEWVRHSFGVPSQTDTLRTTGLDQFGDLKVIEWRAAND